MKNLLICLTLAVAICLCGCAGVKYVANCESAQLRREPSVESEAIGKLMCGDKVRFEGEAENGYSKVSCNGVTGYVLSEFLSDKKPEKKETFPTEEVNLIDKEQQYGKKEYPTGKADGAGVEEYIKTYVRPLYNHINSNIDSYSTEKNAEGIITWYDGINCVKKEFPSGAYQNDMSRQYYYDAGSGQMVFAFIFKGKQEHRLYFRNNEIVRYIDENGEIFDYPNFAEAVELADYAMTEAY
ncbi:MAG: SH3 domain-containing protein [Clostridia bacterium]|nr:SH3 domain-containing protein [Clostridia bacterium]